MKTVLVTAVLSLFSAFAYGETSVGCTFREKGYHPDPKASYFDCAQGGRVYFEWADFIYPYPIGGLADIVNFRGPPPSPYEDSVDVYVCYNHKRFHKCGTVCPTPPDRGSHNQVCGYFSCDTVPWCSTSLD